MNRTKEVYERLGTVGEARDILGLLDAAAVFELHADGLLDLRRDDPERPTTWIVYRLRG